MPACFPDKGTALNFIRRLQFQHSYLRKTASYRLI